MSHQRSEDESQQKEKETQIKARTLTKKEVHIQEDLAPKARTSRRDSENKGLLNIPCMNPWCHGIGGQSLWIPFLITTC